ncbi:glycosyl hydrolase family 8 [Cryptosporangium minutisporangium]|uniref:Glucanase n=1 Tax=Cryptosporangium minutisporangium TaxID=113569 RepID=A0ABP6T1X9_9ACTN
MSLKARQTTFVVALLVVIAAVAASAIAFLRPASDTAPVEAGADHAVPFAVIRPSAPQEQVDDAVARFYRDWKASYLRRSCAPGTFQVYSPDARYPYVAEGQGYGLVITALMSPSDPEAKATFDGLLTYVLAHPSSKNPDLMAAEQDSGCNDRAGGDSATDGDMDIAYALLLADRQWGSTGRYNYRDLALRRIQALKSSSVNPSSKLMLLGNWSTAADPDLYATTRPSDWMPHYFRAFETATGDPAWSAIRAAHQRAIDGLQSNASPATGLLPDFARATGDGIHPVEGQVLEGSNDGDYYFNACRTPWRIGTDALFSGDPQTTRAARKISAWFRTTTGGDPDKIGSGYRMDGTKEQAFENNAFWAPLAVSAMADPDAQDWLDKLWAKLASNQVKAGNYFGDTIQLQVMIVVTGHYIAV